jgi:hypothetical protein
MTINLTSPSGTIKQLKTGFSWTVFFFGFFPPLFRGDLKWAGIIFVVGVVCSLLANFAQMYFAYLGIWAFNIFMAISYNKTYIKELVEKGWTPADHADEQILKSF